MPALSLTSMYQFCCVLNTLCNYVIIVLRKANDSVFAVHWPYSYVKGQIFNNNKPMIVRGGIVTRNILVSSWKVLNIT